MADHKTGEMDITEQEQTFDSFMSWTTRVAIAIIVLLVWMAIFIT